MQFNQNKKKNFGSYISMMNMMPGLNSQQKSSSSISDGSQLRYQKAVKEISKLINVNSNFRKQLENYKQAYSNLQQQFQTVLRDAEGLRRDRDYFENKVNDMEVTIKKLEEICAKNSQNAYSEQYIQKLKKDYSKKIEHLEDKLNQQGHTIIKLEDIVGERQKENVELKNQMQIYQNQKNQERQKYQRMKTQESKGSHRTKCPKCEKHKRKQKQYSLWCAKVSEQNVLLKKKITWLELNTASTPVSLQVSAVNPRSYSGRSRSLSVTDLFRNNYHDRIRELEMQKKSLFLINKKMQNTRLREKLTKGKQKQSQISK